VSDQPDLKAQVRDFWDAASCGESYAVGSGLKERLEAQARTRYELEPYILEFARFHEGAGKDVLEIGVGMGADHLEWARSNPCSLTGIDLTPRAVEFTRQRLALYSLTSDLREADTENLPFADNSFDMVYSFGVLHHSPDTSKAFQEVRRVLRPGGTARIMIYHKYSVVGYMLWVRYGLLTGKPFRDLDDIYAHHLESPGTKAYTIEETRGLCTGFSSAAIRSQVSFGDLLQGNVGKRHPSALVRIAKKIWPRWLIKRVFRNHGGMILIDVVK